LRSCLDISSASWRTVSTSNDWPGFPRLVGSHPHLPLSRKRLRSKTFVRVFQHARQQFGAVGREQARRPRSARREPRQIHARLQGEHHAGLQHVRRVHPEVGRFVDLQPEAVPQAVVEVFVVPCRSKCAARAASTATGRHAGADRFQCASLGVKNDGIQLSQPVFNRVAPVTSG